ncbi:hypothetical protein D3C71_803690 [compost metagenome]
MQTQGNAALHGVAGDQIEVGEIGDQLQHRAHIDVLEIQREFFAAVGVAVSIALLQVVGSHRADADGQFVVGLVGRIIEGTTGLDGDGGPVACSAGIDELHGRGEVLDVQAHTQRLGQSGSGETENDLAVTLLNVWRDGRIGQVDHHIAFALGAALEIHRANSLGCWRNSTRRGRGNDSGRLGCPELTSLPDHHKQVAAFDPGVIRGQLREVDDQPCSVLGFHHRCAAGIAAAQIAGLARQLTDDAGQVQRNPRRRFGGVPVRRRGRLIERQLQLDAVARQRCDIQRLEVGRLYHRRQQRYP